MSVDESHLHVPFLACIFRRGAVQAWRGEGSGTETLVKLNSGAKNLELYATIARPRTLHIHRTVISCVCLDYDLKSGLRHTLDPPYMWIASAPSNYLQSMGYW